VDPVAITLRLEKAYIKKYKRTRGLTPPATALARMTYGQLAMAYRLFTLCIDEFEAELTAREYPAPTIAALVSMETARIKPVEAARLPTFTETQLRCGYRIGKISEKDLRAELKRREFTPVDIDTFIAEAGPVRVIA